ncbi:MAG: hypothetical protein FJ225_11305 [Lentisphaerae bacterium]|nr:hypothetical protein [Lentisphaerota bacterium]
MNLYDSNGPAQFWGLASGPAPGHWEAALRPAMEAAGLRLPAGDIAELLELVLGEGQFGPDHWRLSPAKRAYYRIKPALPRLVIPLLRRVYQRSRAPGLEWPVEPRYARFVWEAAARAMAAAGLARCAYRRLWPGNARFAFVLTHDIESAAGQAAVRRLADIDERFGFRAVFNFVLESYPLDHGLIAELRARGFEIGAHGLRHDGRLFDSRELFMRRAQRINAWLDRLGAVGFRSPLTLRHPEWMQVLNIEYDLSFFDTDPFEPIPGGVMSVWPFFMGRFVELPYTLVQDSTLTGFLRAKDPQVWLRKLDFLERHRGLALMAVHPDYLLRDGTERVYAEFLDAVRSRGGYWHALPREVARWWRDRARAGSANGDDAGEIRLVNGSIEAT